MESKPFGPLEGIALMQPILENLNANDSLNREKDSIFGPHGDTINVTNTIDDSDVESGKSNAQKNAAPVSEKTESSKAESLSADYLQNDLSKSESSTSVSPKLEYLDLELQKLNSSKLTPSKVNSPKLVSSTFSAPKYKSTTLNSKQTYECQKQEFEKPISWVPYKAPKPEPKPPPAPTVNIPGPPRKPSKTCASSPKPCPPSKPCPCKPCPCKPCFCKPCHCKPCLCKPCPNCKPSPPCEPPSLLKQCPCCKPCQACNPNGDRPNSEPYRKITSKSPAECSDPITKVGKLLKKIFETTTNQAVKVKHSYTNCNACQECEKSGTKCKNCEHCIRSFCSCKEKEKLREKNLKIEPVNDDINRIMNNIKSTTNKLNVVTTSIANSDYIYNISTDHFNHNLLNLPVMSTHNFYIKHETNPFQQERQALEARVKEMEDTIKPQLEQIRTTLSANRLIKRNVQDVVYTAKDVAALEVIVDLMQQSPYDAPMCASSAAPVQNIDIKENTKSAAANTNSIEVHIDIPYVGYWKRSANDPIKIRRVFAAKMSSPVDLEYKVQSFQVDNPQNSATCRTTEMSPGNLITATELSAAGVLFLMDPHNSRSFIPIKSFKNIIVRQTNESTPSASANQKMETTTSVKNMGRVTLSKDFIMSLNEELIKLYDKVNMVNNNNSSEQHNIKTRDANQAQIKTKILKQSELHKALKRLKKLFQHDRVCNCKCKPNQRMCKACAATDAVMNELLFEIDNLLKYMTAHCTEIQTYFYMNPTGGRKLKDAVHKVDVSLNNYYKRVKGNCQGKLCAVFSYAAKRSNSQPLNESGYIENHLVDDLGSIAYILKSIAKLNIYANDSLRDHVENLVTVVKNCSNDKRTKRNEPKESIPEVAEPNESIYTLDNINVNIICRPDTTAAGLTKPPDLDFKNSIGYIVTDPTLTNIFNYDDDEVKNKKKYKGLKKLLNLSRKSMKLGSDKTFLRKLASFAETKAKSSMKGGSWFYLVPSLASTQSNLTAIDVTSSKSSPIFSQDKRYYNYQLKAQPSFSTKVKNNVGTARRVLRSYNVTDIPILLDSLARDMNALNKLFDKLPAVQDVMKFRHPMNTNIEISTPLTSTSEPNRVKLRKPFTTKSQGFTVTTFSENVGKINTNVTNKTLRITPSVAVTTQQLENFSENLISPLNTKTAKVFKVTHGVPILETNKYDIIKAILGTTTIRNWYGKHFKYTPDPETESTESPNSDIDSDIDDKFVTYYIRKGRALFKNNLELLFDGAKDVLSQRTTTIYPTIFIIDDYDNEGVDDIIERATEEINKAITKKSQHKLEGSSLLNRAYGRIKKEKLLLDVLKYEKDKVSDEMRKVVNKHDITSTSEDAMEDINGYFFNSPILLTPTP